MNILMLLSALGIWYIWCFTHFHSFSLFFTYFFAHFHHIHSLLGGFLPTVGTLRRQGLCGHIGFAPPLGPTEVFMTHFTRDMPTSTTDLWNPKYSSHFHKVTDVVDMLGNLVWICPLALGASTDVLIWLKSVTHKSEIL